MSRCPYQRLLNRCVPLECQLLAQCVTGRSVYGSAPKVAVVDLKLNGHLNVR